MALAPLPPSNTKRYFVGIQDPNAQHHMQIMVAPSYSDASALSDFTALFTAMADVLFDDYVFNELLVAEKGSDIRNPVSGWIPIVGAATFSQADHDYPLGITARGRSATGRKARFTLWGQFFTVPTNWLYVPVGAPCNICAPAPDRFALISRIRPDGSGYEVVARGVRNSVGFDWDPANNEMWFTDNGRDWLGDDLPSDELDHVTKAGQHFGYPYCHQGDILDPEFGKGHACKDYTPPVLKLGAHVASLGMRFYEGKQFPASYRGAILVAEHGSWNRTKKSGYRVMTVRLKGSKVLSYEPLISGFEQDESAWGRPVDVQPMPDGSVLVSDDLAGAVYRVTYQP